MNCAFRFCFLILVFVVAACEKQPAAGKPGPSEQTQTFVVQGILRAIGFADGEVTVEHEEIPDYMPAMTMPFTVKDMREVQALSAGDAIEFQFIVTKDDSWITGVRKIDPKEVNLPKAPPASATAQRTERLREDDPLPAFQLVDDQGRALTPAVFRGKPLVFTFIFTRCPVPNYCPLMVKNFSELQKATAADPALREVNLLSVSFDPEYDTPEVLAKYAEPFRAGEPDRWRFATGTKAQVEELSGRFALQVKPEGGTINHGLATVLVDGAGVIRKIWRGNGWRVEEVVAELKKL